MAARAKYPSKMILSKQHIDEDEAKKPAYMTNLRHLRMGSAALEGMQLEEKMARMKSTNSIFSRNLFNHYRG